MTTETQQETRKELTELQKLARGIEQRGEDITKYGLFKKAVGQGSNVLGRSFNVLQKEYQKDPLFIKTLADKFQQNPVTQQFSKALIKASEAPERTRNAVMYGLYQQPAFRKALMEVGKFFIGEEDE